MCTYRIGYFDDENREYDNYKVDFEYHNIELVKVSDIETKAQLREYILSEKLDAIIIDYDLSKIHHEELVDGNSLVRYLNIEIPDFPSIILTSFSVSRTERSRETTWAAAFSMESISDKPRRTFA